MVESFRKGKRRLFLKGPLFRPIPVRVVFYRDICYTTCDLGRGRKAWPCSKERRIPMKILIVSQHFFPDDFRVNDIARSLVENGHIVRVLTGLPDYATSRVPKEYRWFRKRREEWYGATVVRVPVVSRRRGVFFRALNYLSFMIGGFFYACFCRFHADAVLSYQTSPVLQAVPAVRYRRRFRVPLLLYCCDLWPESLKAWNIGEGHPLFRLMKRVSCRLYQQCDTVAVTSAPFREYLVNTHGIEQERIAYLPQHAEDLYSAVCGVYEENGCIDFLFAGNVGAVQDVSVILQAASHLKEDLPFRVHIVGAGTELQGCVALAGRLELSDRVVFHGKFPLEEMPRFYRMADCFLLTLRGGDFIGRTLPAKVQGYLSAGKPVLAAADGAVPDLIREADCGICVPAGDAQKLAQAMEAVIRDFPLYQEKGRRGRRYYEGHFTREIFLQRLDGLLINNRYRG